jgi:hypothetical protein
MPPPIAISAIAKSISIRIKKAALFKPTPHSFLFSQLGSSSPIAVQTSVCPLQEVAFGSVCKKSVVFRRFIVQSY